MGIIAEFIDHCITNYTQETMLAKLNSLKKMGINNPLIPSSDPSSVCFNYPEARQDLMLSYSNQMLLISWGVLIAMSIICMGVTALLIKRLDRTG